MVLAAGATPERISYGNTIKKERDIVRALGMGVRLFAAEDRYLYLADLGLPSEIELALARLLNLRGD